MVTSTNEIRAITAELLMRMMQPKMTQCVQSDSLFGLFGA